MCVPARLIYRTNEEHKTSNFFQVAMNNFLFNISLSLLQKSDIYWRDESMDFDGIAVKSRVDYKDSSKKPLELRCEMDLQTNSSAVFAQLVDTDCIWDSLFVDYRQVEVCEDESEIIECRTRFCQPDDQPICLKRYNGRIYEPETQTHTYVLFQKSIQQDNMPNVQASFLVYPIDVYNSRVIFLSSIDFKQRIVEYGPMEAASVLKRVRDQFSSVDLNQK